MHCVVQQKAVTARMMTAPLAGVEGLISEEASEATEISSDGSIEACPAIELVESETV